MRLPTICAPGSIFFGCPVKGLLQVSFALVAFFVSLQVTEAATHEVRLYDFYYEPKDLTITQGDTVRFVWMNAFHDAVAGAAPGFPPLPFQNAFHAPIDMQLPNSYEVTFTRDLLVEFPAPNNRYDYYCTPHFVSGMYGSVTVNRTTQKFVANPTPWQVVPETSSTSVADCTATLNGNETQVAISCSHNVAGITGAQIRSGFVGDNGGIICNLTAGSSIQGICNLTQEQADDLYAAKYYVNIESAAFPNGELRGQFVLDSSGRTISGRVHRIDNSPLAAVTVSDGTRVAVSDASGNYMLTGVSGGVYRMSAVKEGFQFLADSGSNLVVVHGANQVNVNFTANPGNSCLPDTDGDGVCDSVELAKGSNVQDAGSYPTILKSPIRLLWNSNINIINIAAILNRSAQAAVVHAELYAMNGAKLSETDVPVPAQGEFDLILNDMPNFPANSVGMMILRFPPQFDEAIDGQLFYYREQADHAGFEFAFGVPFSGPTFGPSNVAFNTFQPSLNPAEQQNQVAQWLSVVNLDETVVKRFVIERYAQNGVRLSAQTVSIAPSGRLDMEAGHQNPGPMNVGMHRILPEDSSAPYMAHLFRYGGNATAGVVPASYSFAFPLAARAGNGEALFAPISTGGNAENWVEVSNTKDQAVEVLLQFFNTAGTLLGEITVPLAAHAQEHLNAGILLGLQTSGVVHAHANVAGAIIGQSMFYFRDPRTGSITSMYGTPLEETFGTDLYGSYNLNLEMANWLKLSNLTNAPATAILTVFSALGVPNVRTIQLQPYAGVELGLHEAQYGTAPHTYGALRLQMEVPGSIAAKEVRVRTFSNGLIDFASPVPVR